MVKRPLFMLHHAAAMVYRTFRSYAMLSVTIILSFSLLLAYLIYTDSTLYNEYKGLFSKDRNVVSLYNNNNMQSSKVQNLLEKIDEIDNTYYYIYYHTSGMIWSNTAQLESGQFFSSNNASVFCIPETIWDFYENVSTNYEIDYLDGKDHENITLKSGEAIMDEYTFRLLGLDSMETPVYNLKLRTNTEAVSLQVKVVGTFRKDEKVNIREESEDFVMLEYYPTIILPIEDMNPSVTPDSFSWLSGVIFYSESPELVTQTIGGFNFETTPLAMYELQNQALVKIQTEKRTKAMIAVALLLLLGINLYSSFTNALNERKFEIGVKRAIGATSWDIVRQFLYESIIVMLLNILLAVIMVADGFVVYKYIYERIPDQWGIFPDWIIYISPYSMVMFLICAITLTVVFSLIFAYRSTQVEIVQYLKAE